MGFHLTPDRIAEVALVSDRQRAAQDISAMHVLLPERWRAALVTAVDRFRPQLGGVSSLSMWGLCIKSGSWGCVMIYHDHKDHRDSHDSWFRNNQNHQDHKIHKDIKGATRTVNIVKTYQKSSNLGQNPSVYRNASERTETTVRSSFTFIFCCSSKAAKHR